VFKIEIEDGRETLGQTLSVQHWMDAAMDVAAEIARVLVRLNHVARRIVNANL